MYTFARTLGTHEKAVSAVKFSPDGKLVATCSADCLIFVYEVVSGNRLLVLDGKHRQGLNDVIWIKGGSGYYLVACSDDRSVVVWDVEAQSIVTSLTGHKGFVFCLAVHPRNNMVLSGSYDCTARLWDVRLARNCAVFGAHSEPVTSLCFRPSPPTSSDPGFSGSALNSRPNAAATSWCDQFATGGSDGIVRTWDMHSHQCLRSYILNKSPPVPTSRVLWSPCGAYLMVGTLDSTIRLWDAMSRTTAMDVTGVGVPCSPLLRSFSAELSTNTNLCLPMAFTQYPAGSGENHLVSGAETGHFFVWDVESACARQNLPAHRAAVLGLDTTPVAASDGASYVVTGGATLDPTVKLWRRHIDDIDI